MQWLSSCRQERLKTLYADFMWQKNLWEHAKEPYISSAINDKMRLANELEESGMLSVSCRCSVYDNICIRLWPRYHLRLLVWTQIRLVRILGGLLVVGFSVLWWFLGLGGYFLPTLIFFSNVQSRLGWILAFPILLATLGSVLNIIYSIRGAQEDRNTKLSTAG